MNKPHKNTVRELPQTFTAAPAESSRLAPAGQTYRLKVFQSGNSSALRLPKALGLEAGMEMDLNTQPDGSYTLRRADAPKRKIDVSRFAGKAPWLKDLLPEDREIDASPRDWHLLDRLRERGQ